MTEVDWDRTSYPPIRYKYQLKKDNMNGKLWPVTLTISIVGIIGNTLSIVVWMTMRCKRRIGQSHTGVLTYFILLPLVDNFVLLLFMSTETLVVAIPGLQNNKAYVFFYCYVGHPLFFFAVYASGFLVVSLTIQRVQVVLSPLKQMKTNLVLQTKMLVFLAFFISFLLNITSFFAYIPEVVEQNRTNIMQIRNFTENMTLRTVETTQIQYRIAKSSMDNKDIMFAIRCVFATGLPCILIFLANIAIYMNQKMVSQTQIRSTLHRRNITSSTERSIFRTLFLITTSTFFFWLLRCINGCMQYINHTDSVVDNHHVAFQNFGITIGAALNLLIYYLPGKGFRTQLRGLVTKRHLHDSFSSIVSFRRLTSFRRSILNDSSQSGRVIQQNSPGYLSVDSCQKQNFDSQQRQTNLNQSLEAAAALLTSNNRKNDNINCENDMSC